MREGRLIKIFYRVRGTKGGRGWSGNYSDQPRSDKKMLPSASGRGKDYEYNNKKAIIKENNPVASAKANPKIA